MTEYALTRREIQVVEALAAGERPKQIALRLGISVKTVQQHERHLYRKLDAKTAPHAVALYLARCHRTAMTAGLSY